MVAGFIISEEPKLSSIVSSKPGPGSRRSSLARQRALDVDLIEGVAYGALSDLLGYSLRRAQIRIYHDFLEIMDPWSITPPRFAAMILVRNNRNMKLTELARAMGIARSGAVEVVNSLERLGYVRRGDSPTDRRAFALELTAEGGVVLERITALIREHDARISRRLTEQEREQLRVLLGKLG